MSFLPFIFEKKGTFFFYAGNLEYENKFSLEKTILFNHSYYYGNWEEIKKAFDFYPDGIKENAINYLKNYENPPKFFLVKEKVFDLKNIYFVGVLNVTPDSFSDGNLYFKKESAVRRAMELEEEGADIIDIGGQSTRPGAEEISQGEELKRVIPVIEELSKKINLPISIDTTKAKVAEEAFNSGASILNDISALHFDEKMPEIIHKWKPSLILMHIKGKPKNMQENTIYNNFPFEILSFLNQGIEIAKKSGIEREKILVDPGIGFGKDFSQNLWIINNLSFLKALGCPILIGTSRKSFIGKILNNQPNERIYGTIASNYIAVKRGAKFLRVHDVKAHKEFFKVLEEIENG